MHSATRISCTTVPGRSGAATATPAPARMTTSSARTATYSTVAWPEERTPLLPAGRPSFAPLPGAAAFAVRRVARSRSLGLPEQARQRRTRVVGHVEQRLRIHAEEHRRRGADDRDGGGERVAADARDVVARRKLGRPSGHDRLAARRSG